ncbi:MAG: LAGLIDADG family homing endonuclease [Candidatus Omnitrophota bacterium]
MVKCNLCNQKLGRITETHLWYKHKMHFPEFMRHFPGVNIGPMPWSKGETKETNRSLLKLSNSLRKKKKWNFTKWQREKRRQQTTQYKQLSRDEELAELIGIVLGDGSLYKHLRTESLRIICNSKDVSYIRWICSLIKKIFHKTPSVIKRKNENATVVYLYQCKISKRLGLPCGNKISNNIGIPHWISFKKKYIIKCLKGLFETDGCFHEDRDNYTRVIEFKNNCVRLRRDTYNILARIGFNPQLGTNYVRLAKKKEVYRFKELIDFRNYN